MFGSGIYFGNYKCAECYVECEDSEILSVTLYINNPYRYVASPEQVDKHDFDSFAIDLVEQLFSEEKAKDIIEIARNTTFGDYDNEIKERLLELGYDALIVQYEEDWSYEVVVFNGDQCTITNRETFE